MREMAGICLKSIHAVHHLYIVLVQTYKCGSGQYENLWKILENIEFLEKREKNLGNI